MVLTVIYVLVAICLNYIPSHRSLLFLLPSMNTSSFSHELLNEDAAQAQQDFETGVDISLYFFTITALLEAVLFLWTMHQVRDFKEEFNLLNEIKWFAFVWLACTNLILFLMIQGSYSQWLSMAQVNRLRTYLIIVRSVAACVISSVPPLIETYREETFFPIPPNRECIESVDMVLHIPVAIDFFYEYLKNKHNPEGVHWFALYIDLRLYDSTCSDENKNMEDISEMAIRICAEYLEEGAEY